MDGRGTFNLLGIVDDEIAVPYDGEVHRQVTDLHTLVHVLKKQKQRVRENALSGAREKVKDRQRRELKKKKKWYRERQSGGTMRGWKGSKETRLLTICHFCHACLLLSSLTCGDANPGWGWPIIHIWRKWPFHSLSQSSKVRFALKFSPWFASCINARGKISSTHSQSCHCGEPSIYAFVTTSSRC